MNVIGHQDITVNVSFMLCGSSTEDRQKTFVICRRSKNVYAVDTSLKHVVRCPRDLQAVSARHAGWGCTNRRRCGGGVFPPDLGVCSERPFKS